MVVVVVGVVAGVVVGATQSNHRGACPQVTVLCQDDSKRRVTATLTGSTPGAYNVGNNQPGNASNASNASNAGVPSVVPTVESQVDTSLHDEVLSLCATGAVESKQEALDYLTVSRFVCLFVCLFVCFFCFFVFLFFCFFLAYL